MKRICWRSKPRIFLQCIFLIVSSAAVAKSADYSVSAFPPQGDVQGYAKFGINAILAIEKAASEVEKLGHERQDFSEVLYSVDDDKVYVTFVLKGSPAVGGVGLDVKMTKKGFEVLSVNSPM